MTAEAAQALVWVAFLVGCIILTFCLWFGWEGGNW